MLILHSKATIRMHETEFAASLVYSGVSFTCTFTCGCWATYYWHPTARFSNKTLQVTHPHNYPRQPTSCVFRRFFYLYFYLWMLGHLLLAPYRSLLQQDPSGHPPTQLPKAAHKFCCGSRLHPVMWVISLPTPSFNRLPKGHR